MQTILLNTKQAAEYLGVSAAFFERDRWAGARVTKMLRHSSEGVTLRYIGITQQEVGKDFRELVL